MERKKLIIHQPTNHESKKFRYYNIFFDNFIDEVSKRHDVVVDRYYKDAHKGQSLVSLGWQNNDEDVKIPMYECEMIIEDYKNNETFIFSVADDLTSSILNLQNFPNVKKIFVSQFIREKINHHVSENNQNKYHPWIYFPSNEYEIDKHYQNRKSNPPSNYDKMYFRGNTSSRPILNFFNPDILHWGPPIGGFNEYVEEMSNFNVAFSVAGRGELCYRDVECMGLGLPILRFQYLSELSEPLIPNYHYISVDRPDDLKNWMRLDRNGSKHHADMITEKFLEIKNDKEFLTFISENARNYYDNYLSPTSSINYTLNLLGL